MVKTIISVFLFAFVANIAAQTVAVNTTELCTSYRYLVSWDLGPLSSANYTVDSTSISSAIADYQMTSSTGSRYNYLLPQSGFNYNVTMVDAQDRKKDATSFASEPCQNLPTYGKTLGEQATLVLDYHRKQVLGSYRIYRNPKLERLSELFLTTGRQEDIPYFLQQLNAPDWYSYEIAITGTNADAGSLIQILLDQTSSYLSGEKIPFPNSNIMREVGFAYNSTQEKWCIIMTNRTSIKCGNGLLDAAEECDDGNRDNNDGCSSNCQVEDGWSCPDNVLQSGSVCVTTPSYNPPVNSPDQGSNPNSPAGGSNPSDNTPSGSNSPSGGNNPTTGSPSGSNSPSTQQTSGSSKIQFVAATVAFLIALLW